MLKTINITIPGIVVKKKRERLHSFDRISEGTTIFARFFPAEKIRATCSLEYTFRDVLWTTGTEIRFLSPYLVSSRAVDIFRRSLDIREIMLWNFRNELNLHASFLVYLGKRK